jgi:hypothetical protein
MANDQEGECRFIGPDGDGLFWLQRTERTGGIGRVNLGCCDEDAILSAMVFFLEEKGWLEKSDS